VQFEHLEEDELRRLFTVDTLLCIPGIVIEEWRPRRSPAQCHRCQAFAHSSVNCHRPQKCVRCAGDHHATDCLRDRADPPTCANCALAHTANDRRCKVHQREARRRRANRPAAPSRTLQPLPDVSPRLPNHTTKCSQVHFSARKRPNACGRPHAKACMPKRFNASAYPCRARPRASVRHSAPAYNRHECGSSTSELELAPLPASISPRAERALCPSAPAAPGDGGRPITPSNQITVHRSSQSTAH
jgi:hypothetical protein